MQVLEEVAVQQLQEVQQLVLHQHKVLVVQEQQVQLMELQQLVQVVEVVVAGALRVKVELQDQEEVE